MLLVSIAFSVFEYLVAGMLGADPGGFVIIAMAGYSLIAIYALGQIGPSFAALSVDQPPWVSALPGRRPAARARPRIFT